ncbi:hypothetical protein QQP08_002962 [Theobroma cacao]|nr:hypothetical protein QQP08_002962 [Theobroma cacao]
MANVPEESPLGGPSARGAGSSAAAPTNNPSSAPHDGNLSEITRLIRGLNSEKTRKESLDLLCKNYLKVCDDLAILLWNSFGTMRALVEEVTSVYRPLSSTSLSERVTAQVCNAIALLQAVAAHPETRMPFVKAYIPVYLQAFLNTMNREKPYDSLRLSSLVVIGSLVKVDDAEVVDFLLVSQTFPSCLRCMEVGSTLSKTVATFIIHRILLNEQGLHYCLVPADRFFALNNALAIMVERLGEEEEGHRPRLLRNIISCYLRLSDNDRARAYFSGYIPPKLVDDTYIGILERDQVAHSNLQKLISKLKASQRSRTQPTGHLSGPL